MNNFRNSYCAKPIVIIGYETTQEQVQAEEFVNKEALPHDTIFLAEKDIPLRESDISYLAGSQVNVPVNILSFSGFMPKVGELEKTLHQTSKQLANILHVNDSIVLDQLLLLEKQYAQVLAEQYNTQIGYAKYSLKDPEKIFAIIPEQVVPYVHDTDTCKLTVHDLEELTLAK
jgi:hypothetical protein